MESYENAMYLRDYADVLAGTTLKGVMVVGVSVEPLNLSLESWL